MKKKPEVEKDNSERWMLTYLDMITLLFVTFVVLYAISVADKAKFESLAESLSNAFGIESVQSTGVGSGQGKVITNKAQKTPIVPKQSKNARSLAYDNVYSFLKEEVRAGNLKITQNERGILIQLGGKFFFKSGSADLPEDGYDSLITLSQALAMLPNEIEIEGYADPLEVSAPESPTKFTSAWLLAATRATNALEFFQGQGVPAGKMRATSYGSTKQYSKNDTAEGRAYNRHIDILLLWDAALESQDSSGTAGAEATKSEAPATAAPAAAVPAAEHGAKE